ncbi:MAG: hypothetical protein ACTSR8_21560 [Promethearchaeota archaeon]
MEKTSFFNGNKLKPLDKKNKLAEKIEDMWKSDNMHRYQKKKLFLKLETNGNEKRKIEIKLEAGSSSVHDNNYALISELLRQFFKTTQDE